MQFAENNGSQQNIASFVVTTFMKVALSSGQEQRVEDKDDAVPSIFQTFPSYYQKDIKLRRSSRKRQYLTHEVVAPSEVEPLTSGPSPSELQVEHSYFGKKLHVLQQCEDL